MIFNYWVSAPIFRFDQQLMPFLLRSESSCWSKNPVLGEFERYR